MDMDFPIPMRKPNRLQDYDYSQNGAYFVTICTQYRRCLFGKVQDEPDEPVMHMNETGLTVERIIQTIPLHYPTVELSGYCVMPNHVHLLLSFGTSELNPSLSSLINQFKGTVTKTLGSPVWQKGFHDRVVRDLAEYRQIGEYIEHNAAKWRSDKFYAEDKGI
jgi:REP element-mobilizing transposase RayT